MTTQITKTKTVNGVDVKQMSSNVEHVKNSPELANFSFTVDNTWVNGAYNRSVIKKFHALNQENEHAQQFHLDADQPELLLGTDNGPNPLEYLLKALVSCMTTSIAFQAAARGIVIDEIEATATGSINMLGFFGLDGKIRNGLENINLNYRIKADLNDEEFKELCDLGPSFAPVYDSITKGVPVSFSAERK